LMGVVIALTLLVLAGIGIRSLFYDASTEPPIVSNDSVEILAANDGHSNSLPPPAATDSGSAIDASTSHEAEDGDATMVFPADAATYADDSDVVDVSRVEDADARLGLEASVDAREPESTSSSSPVDPWKTRPLPRLLANSRRRVLRGGILGNHTIISLRSYSREHREDPRPHLVLAQSYLNSGSPTGAMERYELAYNFNKNARNDQRMLSDLIRLVGSDSAGDRAVSLIVLAYGEESLRAAETAMARPRLTVATKQRFRRLRLLITSRR
jgi:hypothetical protein